MVMPRRVVRRIVRARVRRDRGLVDMVSSSWWERVID